MEWARTACVIDAAVYLNKTVCFNAKPSSFRQWVKEMRAVGGRQKMELCG